MIAWTFNLRFSLKVSFGLPRKPLQPGGWGEWARPCPALRNRLASHPAPSCNQNYDDYYYINHYFIYCNKYIFAIYLVGSEEVHILFLKLINGRTVLSAYFPFSHHISTNWQDFINPNIYISTDIRYVSIYILCARANS